MRRDRKKNKSTSEDNSCLSTDSADIFSDDAVALLNELNLSQVPFDEEILQLRQSVLHPDGPIERVTYHNDKDPLALHVAIRKDNSLIAVGTLLPEDEDEKYSESIWRIRGMAVRSDMRGLGLGSILLTEMFDHLKTISTKTKVKPSLVWCNARIEALNLYRNLGFEVLEGEFLIPGSGPHQRLKYNLTED